MIPPLNLMRYFIKLAYDGTEFHGWQRQPNANSVQQTIEEALSTILQKKTEIVGAGRTDTGVHAKIMFAHVDLEEITNKKQLLTSLNRLVGKAIVIMDLLKVIPTAHARFDAVSRSYQYHISLIKNPFYHLYRHRMDRCPDIDLMNKAGQILKETVDFTSFAKLHSDAKTNICKVSEAYWQLNETADHLTFHITADRFLRNMVRAVVGTMIEVGLGKISLEDFKDIISKKDRCAAGVSMPAKGLYLSEIVYPKEIFI